MAIGTTGSDLHAARCADVRAVAAQEGFGLIDAFAAFIEFGDYSSDLISGDGIHPNPTGSQVWSQEARRFLGGIQTVTEPRAARQLGQRIYVPLTGFLASAGSPSLGVVNGVPGWALDATAAETILGTFDIPSEWGRVNVYLVWFAAATSGDAKFTPRYGKLSPWEANASGLTSATGLTPSASTGQTVVTASSVSNAIRFTRVSAWDAAGPAAAPGRLIDGRPLTCSITRDAADAADTMAGDAQVVALVIERAE